MIESRPFDYDPLTGIRRVFHWDDETESFTIETVMDSEDIVEDNLFQANSDDGNWTRDMHKVASIPLNIYYDLKAKGIIDDPKAFKKWLNDRDNMAFRTKPGVV